MAKTKISEFDVNPANNTDINNINIAEGCAPSGINNAIRQLMSDLKDLQAGTSGDTIPIAAGGTGAATAANARTALGLAIGTDVQAFDSTILKSANIGSTVQAFDADTAKTDVAQTFTAKQSFSSTMKVQQTLEKMTVSATASTGTINFDALTQSALYFTTDASGNFTVNFRGDGSTSLDTTMATGEALTLVFMSTQGATAYYNSAVTIDGSSVTPKWQGGTAPTSGNASGIDSYVYSIIKTASATFTVLASQTQFK
jgi:hypothetical protein